MRILFTGVKSTGKTTVGRKTAESFGFRFYDLDDVLSGICLESTGKDLAAPEIFEEFGEKKFREYELAAASRLSEKDFCVICTGGSTFLFPEARKHLRRGSIIIFLRAEAETLWQRTIKRGIPKYLSGVADKKKAFIERAAFIEEVTSPFADIIIDSSGKGIEEICSEAVNEVRDETASRMTSANTFGEIIRTTTFGESHGKALGAVLDGLRPNIEIQPEDFQEELDRRKPGQSAVSTSRKEPDKIEILSGIHDGKTTGAPLAFVIYNKDQDSSKYDNLKEIFRPGHADFTFYRKYGIRDHRGGGRSSGRETAARVGAGAAARKILSGLGISVTAYTKQIGNIKALKKDFSQIEKNAVRCPDPAKALEMEELIIKLKKDKDSSGGIASLEISGVPAGLGDPVFYKLDARLAMAIMSLGAVKGVEFGEGFGVSLLTGSQNNDPITGDGFKSNKAGGILGGISNGEDIIMNIAVKPTPSVSKKQKTIDIEGKETETEIEGRHDPCILPRIIPVIESVASLVILDALEIQNRIKGEGGI
ncbi:MAG: chorismate synthase [Fibrobacterota bacterium]